MAMDVVGGGKCLCVFAVLWRNDRPRARAHEFLFHAVLHLWRDHFQYLASIGIFTLMGWASFEGRLKNWGSRFLHRRHLDPGFIVCQSRVGDRAPKPEVQSISFRLSRHARLTPIRPIAHHNMGIALSGRRQWNERLRICDRRSPRPFFSADASCAAYFAVHAKRWEDARHQYQEAIRLGIQIPAVLKDYASLPTSIKHTKKVSNFRADLTVYLDLA